MDVATMGVGAFVGAMLSGWAQAKYLTPSGVEPPPFEWHSFWLLPAAGAGVVMILFGLLFHEKEIPAANMPAKEVTA